MIVVGSGATGSYAAMELTGRGLRVLLLEAGRSVDFTREFPPVNPASAGSPHLSEWLTGRQPIQALSSLYLAHNRHFFVDDVEAPYTCAWNRPFLWIRGRQLGGRLHTWARVGLRLSDDELQAPARDGLGEPWPIRYAELAPYYDRVESFYGLEGEVDGIAALPDGRVSRPRPLTAGERWLRETLDRGWPDRRLIAARTLGAPVGTIPPPLAVAHGTGRLTAITDAVVTRVSVDPKRNLADGVIYRDRLTGEERGARARAVMLCASTIETVRLLLASATPRHPDGLGASSGLLGRYLTEHTLVNVLAVAPGLRDDAVALQGPGGTNPYDLGGLVGFYVPPFFNVTRRDPAFARRFALVGSVGRPTWLRPSILGPRDAVAVLEAFGEVLPRLDNRITLHPTRTDRFGVPLANLDFRYGENELAMTERAATCLAELADEAGFQRMVGPVRAPAGSSIHELGGARMGSSRRTSVLDPQNRVWDVPNLFVTDGASFVTSGYQNCTLTMLALTARACEALVRDGPAAG
ncbi:MAG: GMC family oxidoreductase [Deltaproteobacteria bacterium]|nr:GMC family oxidoreductase [Deltaproteobacteria bacterium]